MVCGQEAVGEQERAGDALVRLEVEDVGLPLAREREPPARDAHDERVPLPVLRMAQDKIIRRAAPGVVRRAAVFPLAVAQDLHAKDIALLFHRAASLMISTRLRMIRAVIPQTTVPSYS